MKQMKLLSYGLLLSLFAVAILPTDSIAADTLVVQTMAELSHPPDDTLEAERVRIWLPVEAGGNCRVRINILDSLNHPIRSFLNRLMADGYYNLYWNKRDNYGRFVEPGTYKYAVNACGDRSLGEVEARFHRWELASLIDRVDTIQDKLWLEIKGEAVHVSISIASKTGRVFAQAMTDSLMAPGRHELRWVPAEPHFKGVYQMMVTVGGYTHPPEIIRAAYPDQK